MLSATAYQRHAIRPATAADCIDSGKINPQGIRTMEYNPVCGCDGKTCTNPCAATIAGVRATTPGPGASAPAK